jgi:hypothetical protein
MVTLDGVRWQELFRGSDPLLAAEPRTLFPRFWETLAPRGQVFGNPSGGSLLTTSTPANASLPGYASIFAESPQGCLTNVCGAITVPTFLDRLQDELALSPRELIVHAAWPPLGRAVTGRDDVGTVQSGGYDLTSEATHPEAALLEETLEMDRGVVLEGFDALRTRSPRFLYLAFLDSDRYGHQARYPRYQSVLETYDRLLIALWERLQAAGDYGQRTAIILTTDHGRGLMDQWAEHGPQIPAAGRVWAYVMLPPAAVGWTLEKPEARTFTHQDVRYTVETLFGLSTTERSGHSRGFIAEVAP